MNNDLISRSALKEDFMSRLVDCNEWIEKAKDKETKIRASAVKTFIGEVIMTINNAPTVEQKEFEQILQPIKVNIPEDVMDKLIEEMSKPRKVILDESKTVQDCIIAYNDGFESARRLFERPHGEWIIDNYGLYHCSNCNAIKEQYCNEFCAKCGADMRKGESE